MIRRLTSADWQEYKRLRLMALRVDPEVYFFTLAEVSNWTDGEFRAEIYSDGQDVYGYWGCFDEETLVGYVALMRSYFSKQQHAGELCNLFVDPAFRSEGIARSLVDTLLSTARSSPVLEILNLSVMSQNQPAIKLYESVGFTRVGIKHKSLKVGEKYTDEVLMQLELSKSQ